MLKLSPEAKSQYDELKTAAQGGFVGKDAKSIRQAGVFKQVHKALGFLASDPRHPSLNIHKYGSVTDPSGRKREVFEAYAQNKTPGAYRIFWCYGPGKGEITILAITPHP
jgi:hypothetical protein